MYTRTYTIRIFPTKEQEHQLKYMMFLRNVIWNMILEIKNREYFLNKKNLSEFDLTGFLPGLKEEYPELKKFNSKAAQVVARQVGSSFRSFFALLKRKGESPRPPGSIDLFKPTCITYNQSGWKINGSSVRLYGVNESIEYRSNIQNIQDLKVKEFRIKKIGSKWLCDIVAEFDDVTGTNKSNKVLGIDLGLTHLAVGVDNFGKVIVLPNKAKKISEYFCKATAEIDSKISKTKKFSRRNKRLYKIRRNLFARRSVQVKQALHIQSKKLANMNYHTIVLGDLSVKQLMSKEKNEKKGVRKSFHQSAIDTFRQYLTYKCSGKTNVVQIDERHTTQLNCLTNKKFSDKIELSDRLVQLSDKIIIDRDLNSAINILKRWESYHIAALTPPLDISNVLKENNLFERTQRL